MRTMRKDNIGCITEATIHQDGGVFFCDYLETGEERGPWLNDFWTNKVRQEMKKTGLSAETVGIRMLLSVGFNFA